MKKAVLILLATMSTGAMAGWVAIDEHDAFYVDPSTIETKGGLTKMSVLLNLDQPDMTYGKPMNSLKMQKEYDCAGKRIRDLSMAAHSGKMGGGNVVTSDGGSEPGRWETFEPGSVGEMQWRVACGKVVLNTPAGAKGRSRATAASAERQESAGWLKVAETGSFVGYADQASIRNKGKMTTMWAIYDFKDPVMNRQPAFLALSSKDLFEFDCDRAMWRSLRSTLYAEARGRGKRKDLTQAAGDWAWIGPDSFGESLWKIACRKDGLKTDWVRIDSTPDFDYYVEVPAVPRQQNTVQMRTMFDYRVARKHDSVSVLSNSPVGEYDCANRRQRNLARTLYSRAMGNGEKVMHADNVADDQEPAWESIARGSKGEYVWKIACGKVRL